MGLDQLLGMALLVWHIARRGAWAQRPTLSLQDRLATLPRRGLPIHGPVVVLWDDHHIPFIEAEEDEDLAVGLGLVHAHLRLGQLEMRRRVAKGRISEVIGSVGIDRDYARLQTTRGLQSRIFPIDLDHLMRTLDVSRAVPEILVKMLTETRRWLDAFVRGLNHYVTRTETLPPEFELFGLGREPWSIAAIGRLASADVNWLVWFPLRRFRHDPDWPRLWRRICEHDALARSIEDGKTEAPPNYSYGTPD